MSPFFPSIPIELCFVCLFERAPEVTNDFVTPRNERPWCGIKVQAHKHFYCLLQPDVMAGLGREKLHPEQYLKPNTTYNTGQYGITCPGHISGAYYRTSKRLSILFVCKPGNSIKALPGNDTAS